jgi:hypothetical protein
MQHDRLLHDEQHPPEPARVGVLATVLSVLSAFFGVQNSRARKRDFTRGSPLLFFGVALALTAAFVLSLIVVVRLVLSQAGS